MDSMTTGPFLESLDFWNRYKKNKWEEKRITAYFGEFINCYDV